MTITVTDNSHDYSMHLRFNAHDIHHGTNSLYWFDIVDNTELNF